ncbi:MAG: 2-oxo acid dehydrogenase subunit E2 [Chloroflexales bacterium]
MRAPRGARIAVGRVADRPVVRRGGLAVAACVTLTLVFDHRAIDGHPAALFLAAVRDLLEDASQL